MVVASSNPRAATRPGVDSYWEQEKLEATLREMLENAARRESVFPHVSYTVCQARHFARYRFAEMRDKAAVRNPPGAIASGIGLPGVQ
jgi:hypothetical protein